MPKRCATERAPHLTISNVVVEADLLYVVGVGDAKRQGINAS